jgi:hypothetical protein
LKIYLDKTKIEQRSWEEVRTTEVINDVIKNLKRKERDLLPNKKKRALKVAKEILEQLKKNEIKQSENRKKIIADLISLFNSHSNDDSIMDYDKFAEMWLSILQPALDEKRTIQKRKRKIITLQDLTYTDVKLDDKTLLAIYESCQVSTTLDAMIASCIIAIKKE